MKTSVLAMAFLALPGSGFALDMVTNPAMCGVDPIDRLERGRSFNGSEFDEIEFFCTISPPLPRLDWTREETFVRMGYCDEPGATYPAMFVFRVSPYEPGVLQVFEDDRGTAQLFHLCSN